MSTRYVWNSTKKSDDVIESIRNLTNKKTRIERFSSSVKHLGNNEISFKLWFDSSFREPNYTTPALKGIINETPTGCTVMARANVVAACISNTLEICLVILFFAVGIAALYVGFIWSILVSVIFFLLSIGSLLWFRHTFKKYRNMRAQLEIMKIATDVDCQVLFD